jgi:hypothetical protein
MSFLRRLFPETIFGRRLSANAERRLRLAQARAEERVIEAHVQNALMFVETLVEELSYDRAIDSYVRTMSLPEPLASIVASRTLVALGEDLVAKERAARSDADEPEVRPRLRLNDREPAEPRAGREGRAAG